MWWTVDDRGLLAHASATDARPDLAVRVVGSRTPSVDGAARASFPSLRVRLWYVPHGLVVGPGSVAWRSSASEGLWGAFVAIHVVVAVMWMGLLWFFNFVQTPAYAEMDAAARNNAFDKLTWRALWWFRWAAMATVVMGVLIIAVEGSNLYTSDFWKSTAGVTLLVGILMAFVMLYNVWMIIWPNQQMVIANARNVAAGGEADPNAAAVGARRRDGLTPEHDLLAPRAVLHGRRGALLRRRATSRSARAARSGSSSC